MDSSVEVIGFSAALLMGLAGSAHCFGMCGGIAGAFGVRLRVLNGSSEIHWHTALYQLGRIGGYSLLGLVSGSLGQGLQSLFDFEQAGLVLRIANGILLLLVAARVLIQWNGLAVLERLGARVWKLAQPLSRHVSGGSPIQTLSFGALWGFLPCGMVYSMLAFAALSGDGLSGAALMGVFGLGTAPAMFASTITAAKSVKYFASKWARPVTGALLAAFGFWMIASPIYLHAQSLHIH